MASGILGAFYVARKFFVVFNWTNHLALPRNTIGSLSHRAQSSYFLNKDLSFHYFGASKLHEARQSFACLSQMAIQSLCPFPEQNPPPEHHCIVCFNIFFSFDRLLFRCCFFLSCSNVYSKQGSQLLNPFYCIEKQRYSS